MCPSDFCESLYETGYTACHENYENNTIICSLCCSGGRNTLVAAGCNWLFMSRLNKAMFCVNLMD